jgi:DNA-directed RNA polymerase alpha subunit
MTDTPNVDIQALAKAIMRRLNEKINANNRASGNMRRELPTHLPSIDRMITDTKQFLLELEKHRESVAAGNCWIEELDLSVRVYNALRKKNNDTVMTLIESVNTGALWAVPNIGEKAIHEILSTLKRKGYSQYLHKTSFETWYPDLKWSEYGNDET